MCSEGAADGGRWRYGVGERGWVDWLGEGCRLVGVWGGEGSGMVEGDVDVDVDVDVNTERSTI